jgi:hypothetical protein
MILSVLRYAFLLIHAALYCYICFVADTALRLALAWAGLDGGAIRSLQFALLALLLIAVLAGTALLDRRLSRSKGVTELAAKACGVIAAQLPVLGALAAVPAMAGLKGWLLPALALASGTSWFLCRCFLRVRRKRPVVTGKKKSDKVLTIQHG